MKNLFNIKDKVVVITGGTGVLGKAIAFHLAEEGAKVVIFGLCNVPSVCRPGLFLHARSFGTPLELFGFVDG